VTRTSAYVFEDFDGVAERLRRHGDGIGYLVLFDRTERPEDKLARFDWSMDTLADNPELIPVEEDVEEGESEPFEEDTYHLFEEAGDEDSMVGQDLVSAAVSWLHRMANDNFMPPWRRFRVRVYGPKGQSHLDSFQFKVHGEPEEDEPESAVTWPAPPVPFDTAMERTGVTALDHLGRGYARFLHLLLTGVNQLQQLGAATNQQLHHQLVDSRKQNERLIAAFVEQQGELMQVERQGLDAQKAQAQMQLGQQALQTFDDATRLYLMTNKGLPSELQGLVSAVTSNPDLMQALANPQVQVLLRDPHAQQQLAALLQLTAQQAAAQAQAEAQPAAQPTSPAPASTTESSAAG